MNICCVIMLFVVHCSITFVVVPLIDYWPMGVLLFSVFVLFMVFLLGDLPLIVLRCQFEQLPFNWTALFKLCCCCSCVLLLFIVFNCSTNSLIVIGNSVILLCLLFCFCAVNGCFCWCSVLLLFWCSVFCCSCYCCSAVVLFHSFLFIHSFHFVRCVVVNWPTIVVFIR